MAASFFSWIKYMFPLVPYHHLMTFGLLHFLSKSDTFCNVFFIVIEFFMGVGIEIGCYDYILLGVLIVVVCLIG